jgi:hypothetical protein
VELGNNHAFCAVDYKGSPRRHVRYITQENILNDGLEIHMLFVVTAESEFCFQRHRIGESAFHTFFNSVTGRINEVVQEFKHKNIPRIGDREILLEHFEQAFYVTLVRRGFQLEKLFERLDLNLEQVRRFCKVFNLTEIDPGCELCGRHMVYILF